MAVSLDQFTKQLADSGLLSSDDVQTLVAGLPAEKRPKDGDQLARELVRQKKLTAFQAQQIYAGKGKALVLGNYRILDKLGQGGMGMVLKAEHRRMERLVALKVLSPAVTKTPAMLARFQREVKAAARLIHQNIVPAFDADEAGGTHFLVMEYIEGADLASIVKKTGPLTPAFALSAVVQAALGLEYAHSQGVVHRDIKPANLLRDKMGVVKVLDMGLARLDVAGALQDELTGSGQIMGTVDYMAPEQAVNTKRADHRADIYSLGVTLWFLITARPMYAGDTPIEKLMAHQTQPIPSLRKHCAGVSAALEAVYNRMVAKAPEDRYQSMGACLEELLQCARELGGDSLTGWRGSDRSEAPRGANSTGDSRSSTPATREATPPGGRGHSLQPTLPAAAVAIASPAAAAPHGSLDVTIDTGAPQVGTNPNIPRVKSEISNLKSKIAHSPLWRKRPVLIAAGIAGLLLVSLAVWAIVREPGGNVSVVPTPSGTPTASINNNTPTAESSAPPPAVAPFDAAQAKAHQAAWAAHLNVPVEYTNSIDMIFRLVPPGEYFMGSTAEEIAVALVESSDDEYWKQRIPFEAPRHKVVLTNPVYLGIHEVTQQEYELVMGGNPSHFSATGPGKGDVGGRDMRTHPVELVSWNDAAEFSARLSERELFQPSYSQNGESVEILAGGGYRLPTEAEWEIACRAGTATRFSCGGTDESLEQAGWFSNNSGGRTHPVGDRAANPLGLFDMHGNVWEWVQDWWDANSYEQYAVNAAIDPQGPTSAGSQRVIRGGDWTDSGYRCRAAFRHAYVALARKNYIGFRMALPVGAVQREIARQAKDARRPADPVAIRPSNGAVEVLPCIDLQADVPENGGTWKWDDLTLRSPQQEFARVAIPIKPSGDYEVTIEFVRTAGDGAVDVFLPVVSRQVQFGFDGWGGIGLSGLQAVEGRNQPDPAKQEGVAGHRLENGRRYLAKVTVQSQDKDATITVQLDGKLFVTWTGPIDSLSLIDERFNLTDPGVLGIGAWDSLVEFHSVKLRILEGEAYLQRASDAAKLRLNVSTDTSPPR